jgi:uncharacterized protein (DUF433 family)
MLLSSLLKKQKTKSTNHAQARPYTTNSFKKTTTFKADNYIGNGIYTISDISKILRLPYQKAYRWVNAYWDGILVSGINDRYISEIESIRTVNFYTLIEFYVLYLLGEAGVQTREVIKAHMELSKMLDAKYPFAQKEILLNINTDGRKVYFYFRGSFLSLDGTKQFNLGFIDQFFKNLEFDQDLIASKFWPMGKQNSIVLDPKRQLGQPVINETNIQPQVLFTLFKGGESIPFIAYLYDLDEKSVKGAIDFCNSAA